MKKQIVFVILLLALLGASLNSQTLSQIGFILKKPLPDTENIVVLYPEIQTDKIVNEAQNATLITRIKFQVYGIKTKSDIPRAIKYIDDLKNPVVIIIGDNGVLNFESVKYVAQKLGAKDLPVVSNRAEDTKAGALLSVVQKGDIIETHLNKAVAAALKITLQDEFLSGCIVDIQSP
jgi:hypothetical protein